MFVEHVHRLDDEQDQLVAQVQEEQMGVDQQQPQQAAMLWRDFLQKPRGRYAGISPEKRARQVDKEPRIHR